MFMQHLGLLVLNMLICIALLLDVMKKMVSFGYELSYIYLFFFVCFVLFFTMHYFASLL